MHGYAIKKRLERTIGKPVSPAHIYPFLSKLAEEGYLEVVSKGRRGKKVYRLTSDGRRLVERIMERMSGIIDGIMGLKVMVCANCGCKIYEGGVEVVVGGKKLFFCCEHCARSYLGETGEKH